MFGAGHVDFGFRKADGVPGIGGWLDLSKSKRFTLDAPCIIDRILELLISDRRRRTAGEREPTENRNLREFFERLWLSGPFEIASNSQRLPASPDRTVVRGLFEALNNGARILKRAD
ncbi:MAG: hypothetical protein DI637_10400 [Citromicrobium sp.]|nr:MAG: hypothetical protein DI637_10400 [Citromicrobium sp.]